MEIVFKKEKDKKHVCSICDKQFNWDENSWYYGKLEYEFVQEQKDDERFLCSDKCLNKLKKIKKL